jgi:outer membrane protein assembly factor BamB
MMSTPLLLLFVVLIFVLACTASGASMPVSSPEPDVWRIGWPMHHGPNGNLVALRSGVALVDDLAEARLVWVSEDADLGSAKTGSQTFRSPADIERRLGPDAKVPPGNWAGVIAADGRVFASTFRPVGPVFSADRLAGKDAVSGTPFRFRLDAEDVVLALDAETGRTLWRAAEPGGWIRGGGKREGFQVAPAFAGGRVFSLGSTGRLFAHDPATGKKLWQSDIGPTHTAASRDRESALAAAAAGRFTAPSGPAWHTSLVVAEDVLIAPTFSFSKSSPNDTGLAGFSSATGAEQPKGSVP